MNLVYPVDQGGYIRDGFYAFVRQRQDTEAPSKLLTHYLSTLKAWASKGPKLLLKSLQAGQKGQTFHPPNPGAPRRALSQARPQRVKTGDVLSGVR